MLVHATEYYILYFIIIILQYIISFIRPNSSIIYELWYRYANFYSENGKAKRDLFKAYGIRYVVKVTGRAGKFSVVPLLLNIGSGLGLLAVVSTPSFGSVRQRSFIASVL